MAMLQTNNLSILSYISVAIVIFALILNVIGVCLVHKHGAQRTHQNVILLHLSILQIPILSAALVYWISVLIGSREDNIVLSWSKTLLISSRMPVIFIIALLTFDRLIAIKYSLMYWSFMTKRRVMAALIASWFSWIACFSILISLNTEESTNIASLILFPVQDFLLLLFIVYTYCCIYCKIHKRRTKLSEISTNAQQTQSGGRQALLVSTTIIFSYAFLVLLPDVTISTAEHFIEGNASEITSHIGDMLSNCYFITLPLTYIFLNSSMRELFVASVLNFCRNKNKHPNAASTTKLTDGKIMVTTL